MIDWNIIIPAAIVGVPIVITSIANLIVSMRTKDTTEKTAQKIDGRMDELLALAKSEAAATATVDEKNKEGDRKIEALRVEKEK